MRLTYPCQCCSDVTLSPRLLCSPPPISSIIFFSKECTYHLPTPWLIGCECWLSPLSASAPRTAPPGQCVFVSLFCIVPSAYWATWHSPWMRCLGTRPIRVIWLFDKVQWDTVQFKVTKQEAKGRTTKIRSWSPRSINNNMPSPDAAHIINAGGWGCDLTGRVPAHHAQGPGFKS